MSRYVGGQAGGVFVADQVLLVDRGHHAWVALFLNQKAEIGPLHERIGKRRARQYDEGVIGHAGLAVFGGEWAGHIRFVGVGPRHEKNRLTTVLAHGGTVFFGRFIEDWRQLGMHRALAAVHHHQGVKRLVELVDL